MRGLPENSPEEVAALFQEGKSLRQKIERASHLEQCDLERLQTIGNKFFQGCSEDERGEIISWFKLLTEKRDALVRRNPIEIVNGQTRRGIDYRFKKKRKTAIPPSGEAEIRHTKQGEEDCDADEVPPDPWHHISPTDVLETFFTITEGEEKLQQNDVRLVFCSLVEGLATAENREGMTECLTRLQVFCIEHNVRDNTSRMLLTTIFVRRDLPEEDRQLFMAKFPDLFGVSLDSDDKEVEIEEAFERFLATKDKDNDE